MKINVFVFNKINYNFPKLKIKIMKTQTGRAKLALLFLALALVLYAHSKVYGQIGVGREFQIPTAQTWGFIKYGVNQPSLYTGSVNVSIPFYNYSDSDFQLPISFCYSSNGMRPNVGTGPLGHDWVLNVGGCITREIRGVPDDEGGECEIPRLALGIAYPTSPMTTAHVNGFSSTRMLDRSVDDDSYLWAPLWYGKDVLSRYIYSSYNIGPEGYYEIEPDIFHYNFMGHSGTFHMWFNNTIVLNNTSDPTGTIKVDLSDDQLRWIKITFGDGYQYVFGYIPGESYAFSTESIGYGYIDEVTSEVDPIVSWYLYKVIAPSGRVMYFDYEGNSNSFFRVLTYAPASIYSSIQSLLTYSGWPVYRGISQGANIIPTVKRVALPSSIHFSDSTAKIIFTYYPHSEIQRELNNSGDEIERYIHKLKKISVVNKLSDTIKTCSFKYIYSQAGNHITFLDTLSISGEGKYSFDYIGLEEGSSAIFPKFGTFSVDHWGYYNGRLNGETEPSFEFANPSMFTIDSLYDEHINGTTRNASYYMANLGLLSRIRYPAGGCTTFSYEPNAYSKDIRRDHTTGFYPYLKNDSTNAQTGGLRIKSITNYNSYNVLTDSKRYSYTLENSTLSSGIQLYFPRYHLFYDRNTERGPEAVEFISGNDVNSYGTGNIEYSRVVETSSDSSKIVYEYSNYNEIQDYLATTFKPIMYKGYALMQTGAETLLAPHCSEESARGNLLRRNVYDGNGNLLSRDDNSYDYGTVDVNQYLNIKGGEIAHRVPEFICHNQLSSSERILYTASGNITSSISNDYDNLGRVTYACSQTSDNHVKSMASKFADNMGTTSIYKSLIHRNMLTIPIEQTITCASDTTSSIIYQYDSLRQSSEDYMLVPTALKKYNPEIHAYETQATYGYDLQGRIIEVTDRNDLHTSYIWGYSGLCIVAKVDNATTAQLKSISGLSNIDSSPLAAGIEDYESSLRAIAGVQVTSFSYKPLVGLIRIKDPSGKSIRYDYNKHGKLYKIVDHFGHIVNKYHYSTDNK